MGNLRLPNQPRHPSSSSLSDLTIWRNLQLRKLHRLENDFNYGSKNAWLFQVLTRFSSSPTGC
jgi:hypothetical protein